MIIRRVIGESMVPTLKSGTIVIAGKPKNIKVGDVVFAKFESREVVKRVTEITEHDYFLQGDNAGASTDSRTKGLVSLQNITGRVIWPRI